MTVTPLSYVHTNANSGITSAGVRRSPYRSAEVRSRDHEYTVQRQLELRSWDVTDMRIESIASKRTLRVLNQTGSRMSGPDFIATRLTSMTKWAIDVKTNTRPNRPPGQNWYTVSWDALLGAESYQRVHNIPFLFVVGDLYCLTPAEVRDGDKKASSRGHFLVASGLGRTFDTVFGSVGDYPMAA